MRLNGSLQGRKDSVFLHQKRHKKAHLLQESFLSKKTNFLLLFSKSWFIKVLWIARDFFCVPGCNVSKKLVFDGSFSNAANFAISFNFCRLPSVYSDWDVINWLSKLFWPRANVDYSCQQTRNRLMNLMNLYGFLSIKDSLQRV